MSFVGMIKRELIPRCKVSKVQNILSRRKTFNDNFKLAGACVARGRKK